ncbi:STM3941 family protein [Robbsia sp. KACC 23696]|uniref:STM3941 family protein n=1 Tax=Robbsia sp. KACC 23696 TaxID=3149231 RepID=UPI00325C3268
MEPIVFYQSRLRLSALTLGAAMFVALAVWLLVSPDVDISATATIAAYLCIPFFGLCGLFGLSRLVRRCPALIIDDRGLTDHTSAISIGFIPWSDVIDAKIVTVTVKRSRQKYLRVSIRNPNAYVAKAHFAARYLLRMGQRMNAGTLVNIPQFPFSEKLESILPPITAYIERQSTRSGASLT